MIQRASLEYARGLAEVQIATWRHGYAHILPEPFLSSLDLDTFERNFHSLIERPDFSVWGAWEGGDAVGYVVHGPKNEPHWPGDFEIRALYVRPSAQGRGLGHALLRESLPAEAEKGHTTAIVWAFSANLPARQFYEKLGGQHVGSSEFELGGVRYPDDGYLFSNLGELIRRLRARAEPATHTLGS